MHVIVKTNQQENAVPTQAAPEGDDDPFDPGSGRPQSPAQSASKRSGRIVRFPTHRAGILNPAVRSFRKKHFPGITTKLWNDWQWQTSHRIRSLNQLEKMIVLSDVERAAFKQSGTTLPLGITPYYMSLVSPDNPDQPIRRTVIPTIHETVHTTGEADDPLGEDAMSPVPGLVHRYPDRVLLLLSDFCSTYCRYCTRSRVVGHGAIHPSRNRLERAFAYIEQTPSVRDVLISGGDPLMLGEEKLSWVLSRLRQIPHVEIVRIGTKVPAVLPQRITARLVRMLRQYHPLWMSLHFTHPDECTPEASRACAMLADAGIPLGSQTVLLKGVNDNLETMRELVHKLLKMRVRPYYLYQCDPITGSAHFRTPVETGLSIIRGLRGFTSGYALPTYVIDAPGGGGKIPLMPDYVVGREDDALILRNYENKHYRYPEPCNR
ncbi:KamA family radical SAM protein [Desulfosarcina ovata]|uniref:L-lysine 2,3-aminomutase n=1 Tax=Desulfosarcina ovata subsp. ovata TaxID=2752305 RepID=A0A5K8AFR9_9BACT|nr:KamA family radical SAM protein [Desulfosarcina ovata]BBO91368.1 L-lysine 2,3-aminomutase [Desulfosarcina ovata subsp. ovata]